MKNSPVESGSELSRKKVLGMLRGMCPEYAEEYVKEFEHMYGEFWEGGEGEYFSLSEGEIKEDFNFFIDSV